MYCPRLDHFVRFNTNGTISVCGHMTDAPQFGSYEEMISSDWLQNIFVTMGKGIWPAECIRCKQTENSTNSHSIRINSIERDRILSSINKEYLILGGVLDNVCNSACQSCNQNLSTKIGGLIASDYPKIDNSHLLDAIPFDRVVELDLNGGEPTASPRYKQLLENLPPSVKIVRVNTNGGLILPNIENILESKIKLIITLSLDGTGKTHDYVRWPIKWEKYTKNVERYKHYRHEYTNLRLEGWTVLHSLNAIDFANIVEYAEQNKILHSWSFLTNPTPLDPLYANDFTQRAKHILEQKDFKDRELILDNLASKENNQEELDNYIQQQDKLRNINIKEYYENRHNWT